jgi:hypothetical protein
MPDESAPASVADRQPPAGSPTPLPVSRPQLVAWTLLGLLPLSALAALVILHLMAASAAAATGGCGGG